MKVKVDENLPEEIVEILSVAGHDAISVAKQNLAGADDKQLAAICCREERCLVTRDFDFSDIRLYPPKTHPGILVLNPKSADKFSLMKMTERISSRLSPKKIRGTLWIVEEHRIRIREE